VDGDPVGESGEAGRHPQPRADHRRRSLAQAKIVEVAANQMAALGDRAGQGEAEAVEDGFLAEGDHVLGQILRPRLPNEIGHMTGQRPVLRLNLCPHPVFLA
jgi:hypothetical protein